jgi:hypothetical protein
MEDVEIQIDEIKDFIIETYHIVLKACHRTPEEGCYEHDFYFHMIPIGNAWWMSSDHPVAIMLTDNNYQHLAKMAVQAGAGEVVVYSNEMVRECINSLVEYCRDKGLKILKTELK